MSNVPVCKKCGDPVPNGKTLCWCCEHGPKLHVDHSADKCGEDSCKLHLEGGHEHG